MLPQTRARKQRNSTKINLLISFTFHSLIVVFGFYFAAREGLLGNQLKKIAVEMVKKEKPKEPEKKKEDPKKEPPKEQPKSVTPKPTPKVETKVATAPKLTAPAPRLVAPPVAVPSASAPPAFVVPTFQFGEQPMTTATAADPVEYYQALLQSTFTSKWDKPEDVADDEFVAEVRVSISPEGKVTNPQWLKGSGNARWDDSVRKALSAVNAMNRRPPPEFPRQVVVRFDVQELTETALQVSQ